MTNQQEVQSEGAGILNAGRKILRSFWCRLFKRPALMEGDFSVYRGTIGYGLYWHGQEVWSLIHKDFLASRWFDTPEEALSKIEEARQDLHAARFWPVEGSDLGLPEWIGKDANKEAA